MSDLPNPFEFEAANNLPTDAIIDYYIEDNNYSRFIRSKRNVFLIGERGCGKTMTLVYNSLRVQKHKATKEQVQVPLDFVGIYIPCKTPITQKAEYLLLEEFPAVVLSEHYLTLSILFEIANNLSEIPDILSKDEEQRLRQQIRFAMDIEIQDEFSFFNALKLAIQRENALTQRALNEAEPDAFYKDARSFSTTVIPLIDMLKETSKLRDSHFLLMLDDAHDMNPHQSRAVNSWIAYRDHSTFSFKVASAKVGQPSYITTTNGSIFEGHDFVLIDMEQPYHNNESNFGQLARKVIQKRLAEIHIEKKPEDFFPANPQFEKELEQCKQAVRKRAEEQYSDGSQKQINDYVYKYTRAEWFRTRSPHANLPAYSGFQTLVYLSTGVIRNLLEPCYWMYDEETSRLPRDNTQAPVIKEISPAVQRERIIHRSRRFWEWLKSGLDKSIENCSRDEAEQVHNLFDSLALLFRERLEHHRSEPCAISFTISSFDGECHNDLLKLLDIARKAQLLYTRGGSAKEKGKLETYYIPNRMLWPARGLDPYGQHARVSIKAEELLNAARGQRIPFDPDKKAQESDSDAERQNELF